MLFIARMSIVPADCMALSPYARPLPRAITGPLAIAARTASWVRGVTTSHSATGKRPQPDNLRIMRPDPLIRLAWG